MKFKTVISIAVLVAIGIIGTGDYLYYKTTFTKAVELELQHSTEQALIKTLDQDKKVDSEAAKKELLEQLPTNLKQNEVLGDTVQLKSVSVKSMGEGIKVEAVINDSFFPFINSETTHTVQYDLMKR